MREASGATLPGSTDAPDHESPAKSAQKWFEGPDQLCSLACAPLLRASTVPRAEMSSQSVDAAMLMGRSHINAALASPQIHTSRPP